MPRPNGEIGYSFRPDAPDPDNPGRKYEQPCKALGGPGNFLGVYETSPGLLGDACVPLYFVEGVKKALSLVSAYRAAGRELVVVAISGVWNWLSGGPIPDIAGLLVEGRKCGVVFDSDMLRNQGVQGAAERLSEYLLGRGASVRVAYLHDGEDGSKTGADDFFAGGGTVENLEALMRPYDPADFAVVRLERDALLARAVEDLEARLWATSWTSMAGGTDRDVALTLVRAARRYGTLVEGGIRVVKSWGDLLPEAGISKRTLWKSLRRLEERGVLRKDNEGRDPDKAGAFVMRAGVNHYGTGSSEGEQVTEVLRGWHPPGLHSRALRREHLKKAGKREELEKALPMPDLSGRGGLYSPVPRLRWGASARRGRLGLVRDTRRVRQGVREQRLPAVGRLGKLCGAILDVLYAHGGAATVGEIGLSLGIKRPCDFARRHFPVLLEAGLISWEGRGKSKVARLSAGWLERLEAVRESCGEIESDRRVRRSVERQREAYRNRHKVVPDHHPANLDADGWVEDLERLKDGEELVEGEGSGVEDEPSISPLARALGDYLSLNPGDACQRPHWLGAVLWSENLFPGKPTGAEVSAALEELGGEAYRSDLLRGQTQRNLEGASRSHASRGAGSLETARAEEELRKSGPSPDLFALISRVLGPLGRVRMGLLCEVAAEEGFDRSSVSEAVRAMGHRVERLSEYGGEQFVFFAPGGEGEGRRVTLSEREACAV